MAIGGCQRVGDVKPDALDDTPVQVDAAMARREWEQSHATYAATGIHTTPTLFTFQSAPDRPNYQYALTELPVFLVNVVLIPVQVFVAPVWKEHEYRAATIPPSYSAMPALPPLNENELATPPAPPTQDEPPATQPSNG
jgi:hypothetical protein